MLVIANTAPRLKMLYLIKSDLEICFKRKRYWKIILFLYCMAFLSYISWAREIYGENSLNIKADYQMSLVLGSSSLHSFYITIMLCIPFLSSLLYSDAFHMDKKSGILTYFVSRCSQKRYLYAKAAATVIINFITVFFLLVCFEIVCWITIPELGKQLELRVPIYEVNGRVNKLFLQTLFQMNPYIHITCIIAFMAIYSSLLGIVALGVSLIVPSLKGYYVGVFVFLGITLIDFLLPRKYHLTSYFQGVNLEFKDFLAAYFVLFLIAIILLVIGVKREQV